MGNDQSQNEKFNPNFNMAQYNQRMNQIRSQYNHQTISHAPGAFYANRATTETMSCAQITRNTYIFKTTIQISISSQGEVSISFEYHCPNQAIFDLGIGVSKIEQHEQTKETINITSMGLFKELLPPGEKSKFGKTYKFDQSKVKELHRYGIMMKVTNQNEYSEYSLTYIPNTKLWKVVVENFCRNNQIFGIEDIYGGEEGQECIICFTDKATTMVKPCNHLCLCGQCAKVMQVKTTNCPICRKKIMSLVKLTKDQ